MKTAKEMRDITELNSDYDKSKLDSVVKEYTNRLLEDIEACAFTGRNIYNPEYIPAGNGNYAFSQEVRHEILRMLTKLGYSCRMLDNEGHYSIAW
jgi:hypothetical protein